MNSDLDIENINLKDSQEEVDLKSVLRFFLRNKKFISATSLIFFLVFCVFSLFLKKVWEGQFEIVVDTQKGDQMSKVSAIASPLTNLAGISSNNSLTTEVGILESPSILMPIFENIVLSKKKDKGLTFDDWKKNNLNVVLKANTSILRISYRDKDKELISTVLNKISKKYQDYSGRAQKRRNELTKNFLKTQVQLYKDKSNKSFKDAQTFAIEQNLENLNLLNFMEQGVMGQGSNPINILGNNLRKANSNVTLGNNLKIEQVRVDALNRIREIDFQIDKIKSLGNNFGELQYIGATIPLVVNEEGYSNSLKVIEENLATARSKYTDNDEEVKKILKSRQVLVEVLSKRFIGLLKAERLEKEAIMEAATRPKEVILKYKELIRQANRDEYTLIGLENQLREIEIEESKLKDPWELITKPTVKDIAVAPSKKRIGLIGLFLGFASGVLITKIKEEKSGLIYDLENLKSLLKTNYLVEFSKNKDFFSFKENQVPIEEIIKNYETLNLIYTSNLETDLKDNFKLFLGKIIDECDKSLKVSNFEKNLSNLNSDKKVILVTQIENLKYDEIRNLSNRLRILKVQLDYIFLIEETP